MFNKKSEARIKLEEKLLEMSRRYNATKFKLGQKIVFDIDMTHFPLAIYLTTKPFVTIGNIKIHDFHCYYLLDEYPGELWWPEYVFRAYEEN
jgi:hypothetical protein